MRAAASNQSDAPTPEPAREPRLLPLDEFRKLIGNPSRATIYRWERCGLINLRRIGGRVFGSTAEADRLIDGDAA